MFMMDCLLVYLCRCDCDKSEYLMDCVSNARGCHHELLSLVDLSIIAHSLHMRQHRECTPLALDISSCIGYTQ